MRKQLALNHKWQFVTHLTSPLKDIDWQTLSETVSLPHTVCQTPYNYFSEDLYQMSCAYKKIFWADDDFTNKRAFLTFEGAGHKAQVYLNGHHLGDHVGGYTAFTFDISDHVNHHENNELVVLLDTSEDQNFPPFGHVIDYMTYGGLYREVYITLKPQVHLVDVFATTPNLSEEGFDLRLQVAHVAEGDHDLNIELFDPKGHYFNHTQALKESQSHYDYTLKGLKAWHVDSPHLYTLRVSLKSQGQTLDFLDMQIGFRTAEFKADGFYLNGQKLVLRGVNRHQSFPYVGYAMPKRPQERDADLCKYELGLNAVRTAHYPQSQHFINRCNEIGLLVFTEVPGWQHIGNQDWQDHALGMVDEMVSQYRNHPSVILWGVRINESKDNQDFYEKTNALARSLDPSRPTGGVRYLEKSQLLEDVYTFNDFSYRGQGHPLLTKSRVSPDQTKAYLVSEYNGHMYPTKTFDTSSHRAEHAKRHADVLGALYGSSDIAGGFAWCMFDYNTHKDFGSGDRICHHGLMDMFRNKKLAAAVYASQQDHTPVLEASSDMHIGDYPGGYVDDFYVYSNADEITLYKNDAFIKTFKPSPRYGHLPHPPFLIDDLVGDRLARQEGYTKKQGEQVKALLKSAAKRGADNLTLANKLTAISLTLLSPFKPSLGYDLYGKYFGNWGDKSTQYRFDAIKNGQVVKTITKGGQSNLMLEVTADTLNLTHGLTYDVASINIRLTDEHGNCLTYFNGAVSANLEGPLSLIGPSLIPINGGMGGTYVKTTGSHGRGHLSLSVPGHSINNQQLTFTINTVNQEDSRETD